MKGNLLHLDLSALFSLVLEVPLQKKKKVVFKAFVEGQEKDHCSSDIDHWMQWYELAFSCMCRSYRYSSG